MDIKYVNVRKKTLENELTTLSSYLNPADKSRLTSMIEEIKSEIMTREEGLVQFENRTSRLISSILALPSKPKEKSLKRFYNRFSDFLLITSWHIYREKDSDVSDEPWVLEEEEKETEKDESKKIPTQDISEEMLGDL